MYYKPEWGRFDNGVFVRNQKYKLYDDGRFYDLELDVMEQHSLSDSALEGGALSVKNRFMEVLSKYPTINR
jgi:arylsulfatase A